MRNIARCITLVALCGCVGDSNRTLIIESNTTWSGSLGAGTSSTTIQRSGNYTLNIGSGMTYCWVLQKETQQGSLRAYVTTGSITSSERQGDQTTTASFGVISGCAD